jgi:FkbM family methyltransferase
MLFKQYLQALLWNHLSSRKSADFASRFKLLNRYFLRMPIKCEFQPDNETFMLVDANGISLTIANPNMIRRYHAGISQRLENLGNEYLVDKCKLLSNDIVLDIGANIGEYSRYAGERFKALVIAIEPEDAVHAALEANLRGTSAIILHSALWSHDGRLTLYHASKTNDTTLIEPKEFDYTSTIDVTTLDNLLNNSVAAKAFIGNRPIKLVKLEAEGAEPEIIRGGLHTLERTEYLAVDCGPERGIKAEPTLVEVVSEMHAINFEIIDFNAARTVLLFRNRAFSSDS